MDKRTKPNDISKLQARIEQKVRAALTNVQVHKSGKSAQAA